MPMHNQWHALQTHFPVELIVREPSESDAVVSVPDGVKQADTDGSHTVIVHEGHGGCKASEGRVPLKDTRRHFGKLSSVGPRRQSIPLGFKSLQTAGASCCLDSIMLSRQISNILDTSVPSMPHSSLLMARTQLSLL